MAARNYIELVEKTMRVLEFLARRPGGCPLKEIAAQTGLVKSSAFRILFSLKKLGYVEQDSIDGEYRTSSKLISLARAGASNDIVVSVAHPHLQHLRDKLGESAWLAQKLRDNVLVVDVVETVHRLRLSLVMGDMCPLHAAGLGKAIAAFLPEAELDARLAAAGLPSYTRRTITSREELDKHLLQVRRQGFAVNREETIEGAIVIGAPIFDTSNRVCAAVSVGSASARSKSEHRTAIIHGVKHEAAEISRKLARLEYHSPY